MAASNEVLAICFVFFLAMYIAEYRPTSPCANDPSASMGMYLYDSRYSLPTK